MTSASRINYHLSSGDEDFSSSGDWTRPMLHQVLDQSVLSELDRRFWAFVESLPPHLARLATDQRTITGRKSSRPLQTIADIGLSLGIPWMFRDTFPGLRIDQWLDVGEAWIFLAMACYLRDHVADEQVPSTLDVEQLRQYLWDRACKVFYSLVSNRAVFWQRFEQYEQQTISALQAEAKYRASPNQAYDLETLWSINVGKWALYKAPLCVMAVLCDAMPYFSQLELSLDTVAAGRQLYDDVIDWQEDLARGHYTYPLVQAIIRLRELATPISPQFIEVEVHSSTIREDILSQVEIWYQKALTATNNIPCQEWICLINNFRLDSISEHHCLILYRILKSLRKNDIDSAR